MFLATCDSRFWKVVGEGEIWARLIWGHQEQQGLWSAPILPVAVGCVSAWPWTLAHVSAASCRRSDQQGQDKCTETKLAVRRQGLFGDLPPIPTSKPPKWLMWIAYSVSPRHEARKLFLGEGQVVYVEQVYVLFLCLDQDIVFQDCCPLFIVIIARCHCTDRMAKKTKAKL